MRIYIASSWKNKDEVKELARVLRIMGHQVYDFTDPEHYVPQIGHPGFAFSMDELLKALGERKREELSWMELMELDAARKAFDNDKAGLDWAELVLLVLPCGRSAHLEAGYAKGQGKKLLIYGSLPMGEFETMYHFADRCVEWGVGSAFRLLDAIEDLGVP